MGNSTQTWRSPTSRNSWRVAALASLALFSSLASAQTDLEKAAIEQQLLVDKMAAQIAAATTSPMATAGATCSAGTTTSTEATITTPDLWVVGNVAASNGYGVYRCVNGAWAAVAGTGATISADVNGVPVLVNATGEIYRGWK